MTAFEAVGRGSIPRWGILIVVCPSSVADARNSAKVEARVRLPAMALTTGEFATRRFPGGVVGEIRVEEMPRGFDLIDRMQERHQQFGVVPPDSDVKAEVSHMFDSFELPFVI